MKILTTYKNNKIFIYITKRNWTGKFSHGNPETTFNFALCLRQGVLCIKTDHSSYGSDTGLHY